MSPEKFVAAIFKTFPEGRGHDCEADHKEISKPFGGQLFFREDLFKDFPSDHGRERSRGAMDDFVKRFPDFINIEVDAEYHSGNQEKIIGQFGLVGEFKAKNVAPNFRGKSQSDCCKITPDFVELRAWHEVED